MFGIRHRYDHTVAVTYRMSFPATVPFGGFGGHPRLDVPEADSEGVDGCIFVCGCLKVQDQDSINF